MSIAEISRWISDVLKEKNFEKCEVKITGDAGKGTGYIGSIAFVTVAAERNKGEIKEYNLVVKYGKQAEGVHQIVPVRRLFQREIFAYTTAIPKLREFEKQKNVNIADKLFTKFFGAGMYDNEQFIILQNLKKLGYEIVNKYQPMDLDHLKVSFKNYGRWHALSFAYRDQRREEFKNLVDAEDNIFADCLLHFDRAITNCEQNLFSFLKKKTNYSKYIKPLKDIFKQGFFRKEQVLLRSQESRSVLLHGDAWSSNVMFLYDNSNRTRPNQAIFIDLQLCQLGSPVLDLSYHLYMSASEKELDHFDDLLQIYYASFSSTLKDLGSDSEKLFPYSELMEHWKKYSAFGFVQAMFGLPVFFTGDHEVEADVMGQGVANVPLDNIGGEYGDIIVSRILAVVKHFVEFNKRT